MPNVTEQEIESLIKIGVQEAKLNILVNDFQENKKQVNDNLTRIYELLRNFPSKINECRDELEKDIHDELEKHYVTEAELREIRTQLTTKIDNIKRSFKWTMIVIVAIAGTVQFITTIWFMGLQIAKLSGS